MWEARDDGVSTRKQISSNCVLNAAMFWRIWSPERRGVVAAAADSRKTKTEAPRRFSLTVQKYLCCLAMKSLEQTARISLRTPAWPGLACTAPWGLLFSLLLSPKRNEKKHGSDFINKEMLLLVSGEQQRVALLCNSHKNVQHLEIKWWR